MVINSALSHLERYRKAPARIVWVGLFLKFFPCSSTALKLLVPMARKLSEKKVFSRAAPLHLKLLASMAGKLQ